jgi:hypothetical protein
MALAVGDRKFRVLWRRETDPSVMAGLVPATHAFGRRGRPQEGGELKKRCFLGRCDHTRRCRDSSLRQRGVDGRDKPGQDGRGSEASRKQPTNSQRHKSLTEWGRGARRAKFPIVSESRLATSSAQAST